MSVSPPLLVHIVGLDGKVGVFLGKFFSGHLQTHFDGVLAVFRAENTVHVVIRFAAVGVVLIVLPQQDGAAAEPRVSSMALCSEE